MNVISRIKAKQQGLKRYFTQKPCKHGHVCDRFVLNGNCVLCKQERDRKYHEKHQIRCNECSTNYYLNNKEKIKKYKTDNFQHNKNYMAIWCQKNRKKLNEYSRNYNKDKKNTDINYKLSQNLRNRLYMAAKNNYKNGSAVQDLGCSIPELKNYLEARFSPEMTWDNYGPYWHIDHIKPLSSFDLTDRTQFLEACHFANLQPLYWEENLSKGARIINI